MLLRVQGARVADVSKVDVAIEDMSREAWKEEGGRKVKCIIIIV